MIEQLYPRLLGPVWFELPEAIRSLHSEVPLRAHGRMRVVNGQGTLARAVIRLLRKPRANGSVDVRLEIARNADGEAWCRTFDGVRLETRQHEAAPGVLAERSGRLEFRFRLVANQDALRYEQMNASIRVGPVRLRLPSPLAPKIEARERPCGSTCVQVQVRITWPPAGLILAYDGDVHTEDHA